MLTHFYMISVAFKLTTNHDQCVNSKGLNKTF